MAIILPTFNRSGALLTCLQHLERQTWSDFEVIVVDDGSVDSTPAVLEQFQKNTHLNFRFLRQENGGPARARNRALAVVESPLCLMIGDDIFASPDLVAEHVALHARRPEINVACLGLTRWAEDGQTVTPFMRWLDKSGKQFRYGDLLQGAKPDWECFYTSNLSLKTQMLRDNPFNESFRKAAMEDIELGYRLQQTHRLEIVLIGTALAFHFHPTTFSDACRRMVTVGDATRQFNELWPEIGSRAKSSSWRRALKSLVLTRSASLPFLEFLAWVMPFISRFADATTRVWCPNPLMRATLKAHYVLGYRRLLPRRG